MACEMVRGERAIIKILDKALSILWQPQVMYIATRPLMISEILFGTGPIHWRLIANTLSPANIKLFWMEGEPSLG